MKFLAERTVLRKVHAVLVSTLSFICGTIGIITLGISIVQIIMRVLLRMPIPWIFEGTAVLAVYFVCSGTSILVLQAKIAKVTIITDRLPVRVEKLRRIILRMLSIAFGMSIVISSYTYMDILGRYQLSNIPISSKIFGYPVIFFGFILVWNEIITTIK